MTRCSNIVRLVVLSLAAWSVWGQSFSGKIAGVVTDSTAATISEVAVTLVNEGTGGRRFLATDAAGIYVAAELPVGYYTVRFESPGLSTLERQKVKVDVGSETRIDVMLSVKPMEQSIDVAAEAPVLRRDSSALAEVVDTRQVEELPLNGRDFRKLAFLVPGAAPRSPRGSLGSFTATASAKSRTFFCSMASITTIRSETSLRSTRVV